MKTFLMLAMCATMAMLAGGCLIVEHHEPPPPPPPDRAATPPPEDPRSASQIAAENRDLRVRLDKAESDRQQWVRAVDAQKRKHKEAERERDRMKDQRDFYKKLNKHDD